MRSLSISFIFVFLSSLLPSQEIHFSFNHITTVQGLLSNGVNAIAQDNQGYIWIGTSYGLQRFDGRRFLNFKHDPKQEQTIPSNLVSDLHFDRLNRLWFISNDGTVGIFDTRKLSFQEVSIYDHEEKVVRAPGGHLQGDEWGNIFIHDKRGVYIWREEKGGFIAYTFPQPASENWQILAFAHRPGTADYIVSFGSRGLFLFHTQEGDWNNRKVVLEPFLFPGYPDGSVAYNVYVDQKDQLWAQFWPTNTPKIYCFDLSSQAVVIRDYEPIELVRAYIESGPFFESQNGDVWIYGVNILAKYNGALDTFQLVHNGYVNDRSILYRSIKVLFEDRENTIWVCTKDNGIFTFNPEKEYFRNISHFNKRLNRRGHGSPMDFIHLMDSTVLVSVWEDGLFRYDRDWNELPIVNGDNPALSLYSMWSMFPSHKEGIIWMSGQPGRIIRYDQLAHTAEAFQAHQLEDRTIRQVVEDQQGHLWLGMQGRGVYHWKVAETGQLLEQNLSHFTGVPKCTISKMIIDAKGWIWIATDKEGLYAINPGNGQVMLHFSDANLDPNFLLPDSGVSSVLEYNDSLILISGISSLFVFNRNRKNLTQLDDQGTIAGFVADLALDHSGNVWVSTTSGLYRVNIHNSTILKFGRRDGIDDDNFVLASSYTLPDGRLLFGASETFVVFDPAVFLKVENVTPEVTITGLQVNNRPVLVDSVEEAGGLHLRYDEKNLAIEFSTLQFYRNNSIRYKMEGLDQYWQINENNIAVYAYLPAGEYRLLLQPIYGNGAFGHSKSIDITRNPPFWRAWWFYSLICLVSGLIIYLFDRERMRRRESVLQMRAKIADNLHAEIKTALNSIHILSEMASNKAGKDPTKAADFLAHIKNKSQQMMNAMDDILWTIVPGNDSMSKIVERIEEYVYKLNKGGQAEIDWVVDSEVSTLVLDMRERQMLLRLVKESISSLLKAGARQLQVHLGRDKMSLIYVIEFRKDQADTTILNNLLQKREMVTLLADMGATHLIEIHRTQGRLDVDIPITSPSIP